MGMRRVTSLNYERKVFQVRVSTVMRKDGAQLLTISGGTIRPTEEGGSPAGKMDGMTGSRLQHSQLQWSW